MTWRPDPPQRHRPTAAERLNPEASDPTAAIRPDLDPVGHPETDSPGTSRHRLQRNRRRWHRPVAGVLYWGPIPSPALPDSMFNLSASAKTSSHPLEPAQNER